MNQPLKNNFTGILFMLGNSLSITVLYAIGKYLNAYSSSHQIVFLYKLTVLVAILPWVFSKGLSALKTNRLRLHLIRGCLSTIGALCFFYGMSKVDIASATAINKTEPLLLMLISALYFKEQLTLSKIATVVIGFVGMLFVVYPLVIYTDAGFAIPLLDSTRQTPAFDYNYLIIILAVLIWTLNSSIIKSLGKTESNHTQLFYVALISVMVAFPTAFFQWEARQFAGFDIMWIKEITVYTQFNFTYIGLILVMGAMYFIHLSCYFLSLKIGEMSVVIPFDYSRLVFSGLISYFIFNNALQLSPVIGYLLIMLSGICLLWQQTNEKRKRQKALT